ncbi:MAG: tryptophan--tRNA ligase [Candidatus Kapabacteria bacterium]|nr:tryptophan--tRNA ligase [Ignavibacteriota bacterium]MCW5885337.1 tryptophan--tRNA ligase [Candidatus Kapabacteria bacterium]
MENPTDKRKVILSGVTPSGILTMGHLAGALTNWVKLQEQFDCYFMIADLHAITVRQNPADLRKRTLETAAMFIAVGIDPERSTLFIQSHVPEHAQLTWVLNTFTGMGECSRMTQFKDKSQQHSENINVGLFDYPVLMASDILLYQADLVPVGEDQKQHLELTRNLAQRFNHNYSDTFIVPDPYIPKVGARIMSLQTPEKKMSKSDSNQNSILFLTDSDEVIKNKIKRSVTDSGSEIKYSPEDKPGVSNLITLMHLATNQSIKEIEQNFQDKGYGDFKPAVADAVADYLKPIREKYNELMSDKDQLIDILKTGDETARRTASKTLRKVYKKVGFVQF